MKQTGVGVIGLGHNGAAFCERYARNLKCKLVAVCDKDSERLDAIVKKYGAKGYSDYKILDDPEIQLISVHTADHQHKEPFVKAIESGRHVFVEKPMADTIEDLKEMADTAARHPGKCYAVGHVLRFNPYFQLVRKWLDLGILGNIFYVECDYIHDLRYQQYMEEWKLSREIPVLGGGCHAIDLLRWYVGDVDEVSSYANRISYPQMREDASMVTILKFKNGCIGKVTSLYGACSPRPDSFNLSVYGTKGTIVRNKASFDGMGEQWLNLPDLFDAGHDFMPEIDHILDCIHNDKPILVTPEEGFKTSLTGLLAAKSAAIGKAIKID